MRRYDNIGRAGGVVLGLVAATLIVRHAGGSHTSLPHLYYLPIGVAAVCGGPVAGLATGLLAGVLAGPLTPLDTDAGTAQSVGTWLVRLTFFCAMGGMTGGLAARVRHRAADLARLNEETVRAFVRAIDSRDPYTARHSEKVARYAVEAADALGADPETLDRVRWAGLLHDLGKLALPEAVLDKPGPLDDDEWALVRRHPAESARIVGGVSGYRPYLPAIRHHHERYDGTGYPDGLQGDDIPFEARILAVADAFDAMTSDRAYRTRHMSEDEALDEIVAGAGSQFDPAVASAFVEHRRQTARREERSSSRGRLTDRPTPVTELPG